MSATVGQLNLDAGNDVATLQSGASGTIDGGSDVDTLNTRASYESNLVGGKNGVVDGVIYTSFEEINMGGGADKATVKEAVNQLNMGDGVDEATVSATVGQLNLDAGNDIATVRDGAVGLIDGGNGEDQLLVDFGDTQFKTTDANSGRVNGVIYSGFESIDFIGGNDVGTISHEVGENSTNLGPGNDVVNIEKGASGRILFEDDGDTANLSFRPDGQNDHIILDGGDDFDSLNFTEVTLSDTAKLAIGGELSKFVSYASSPTGEVYESDLFNLVASDFEQIYWDTSSQESSAVSDSRLTGVSEITVDVDDDLAAEYEVNGSISADSYAVSIGSSAYSELITIGVEDSDFDAEDGISFNLDFGGLSSASSTSTSHGSDAVAVGFGLGFDGLDGIAETDANIRGSELDIAISNVSGVMADADSIVGDVMAVASNVVVDATELMVVTDASLQAAISAEVQNVARSATTAGSSEAVGWQEASLLEHSNMTSGGLGLIDIEATAFNNVSSESVGIDGVAGIVAADANSITTGISETDFRFADPESGISSDLSNSTSASATSVFGNAVANLKSSIKGIFGGSSLNTVENADSISSIVNEQGFAEASSIGGTAESTADQSVEAISSYDIATTEQLTLSSQSSLSSTTISAVTEA